MKLLSKFLTLTTSALLAAGFLVVAPTAMLMNASAETIITQLGIDIDGEAAGDESGPSVSLSSDGTRVAIGANGNDGNGGASGHVRVYEFSGGTWTQLGSDIDGEAVMDQSGYSVSLSSDGTTVAIGAIYNDGNGNSSGHVRIYEFSGGDWSQLGSDIDGEAIFDQSGWSVSLSSDGTRVAIGAIGNDANGANSGQVRIYEFSGGTWTQLGSDIDGEAANDNSGRSVSLSSDGTRVAIGAPYNDGNGNASGHVRIYEFSGGTWTQLGSDIDGEAVDNYSGNSVSLSSDGTRVAIGAHGNDGSYNYAGHVRVYEFSGGTWNQLGSDIEGEAADDNSGWSVSLSSDGTRVAIGAIYNDENGSNSGHVRIYELSGGTWTQLATDIDGEAADDQSGYSVSLSSDGTTVAIGATRNDASYNDAGHVRLYALQNTYSVTFDAQSGSSVALQNTASVASSPATTRTGYNFQGWFDAATDGNEITFPYAPSSDTTLYAQWQQITYNVTFDAQSGTSVAQQNTASLATSPTTTQSGFTFQGWFDAATDGNEITFPYAPVADVTLYAQWVSATPPTPAPYTGSLPTGYSNTTPSIGDEVVVSGLRMNLVTSLTIDGIDVPISNKSADSFTIVIPIDITSGLKDLVMTGPAGKLTAQGAVTIQESIPAIINEAAVSSKVNAGSFNGYVAVYAKGHKGKTLSWKIAGKWFKTTITSDYQVFQRRTAAVGLDVDVHLYINREKQLRKQISTR